MRFGMTMHHGWRGRDAMHRAPTWAACLLALMLLLTPPPAEAQSGSTGSSDAPSLAELYRAARFERHLAQLDPVAPPAAPERISAPAADSLYAWLQRAAGKESAAPEEPSVPPFDIERRYAVRWLARDAFDNVFADTRWAYLGMEGVTPVDTSWTRELRARLEARYGPPTRTVSDVAGRSGRPTGETFQFEYRFVVNDTIPLVVTDVDGPLDRGLVVASDARLGSETLLALRRAFLRPLALSTDRAPYADYFYDKEEQSWYRTGFDGERFFTERIRRPLLTPGRRPEQPRRAQAADERR